MKTSELEGAALDWAVAKCEYFPVRHGVDDNCPEYSTDWSRGGPIIEREFICVSALMHPSTAPWFAISDSTGCKYSGPTPLIAAMRCYVAMKLGDEVEVPEELM